MFWNKKRNKHNLHDNNPNEVDSRKKPKINPSSALHLNVRWHGRQSHETAEVGLLLLLLVLMLLSFLH